MRGGLERREGAVRAGEVGRVRKKRREGTVKGEKIGRELKE